MSRLKSLLRFYLKRPVKLTILSLYLLAVILTGTVVGRVTDSETGEGIEGAVVAASWEWVLPIPPEGEPVNAFAETVSWKNGWFVIFHPTLLIFSYPTISIYSHDHVAWNNRRRFDGRSRVWPNREKRPHRFWMGVSLTPWVEGMSHCTQVEFFGRVFMMKGGLMLDANETEYPLCILERRKIRLLQGEQP